MKNEEVLRKRGEGEKRSDRYVRGLYQSQVLYA